MLTFSVDSHWRINVNSAKGKHLSKRKSQYFAPKFANGNRKLFMRHLIFLIVCKWSDFYVNLITRRTGLSRHSARTRGASLESSSGDACFSISSLRTLISALSCLGWGLRVPSPLKSVFANKTQVGTLEVRPKNWQTVRRLLIKILALKYEPPRVATFLSQ